MAHKVSQALIRHFGGMDAKINLTGFREEFAI